MFWYHHSGQVNFSLVESHAFNLHFKKYCKSTQYTIDMWFSEIEVTRQVSKVMNINLVGTFLRIYSMFQFDSKQLLEMVHSFPLLLVEKLHLNYVICYFFLRNSHYYNNLIVFLKLLELARSNWCQIDVTWGQLWDHKRSKLILTWNTMLTNEIIVQVKSVKMEFYEILWEFFSDAI